MRTFALVMTLAAFALGFAPNALATAVYHLQVNGISCPFCAYGIEKELGKIDGVADVRTEIEAGVVVVEMAEDAELPENTAKAAVRKAGFTLKAFTRTDAEPENTQ